MSNPGPNLILGYETLPHENTGLHVGGRVTAESKALILLVPF